MIGTALATEHYQMTEAQIGQAEALVGEWLRERLEDFDQYRVIGGCPDDAWNGGKPFDYAAFNAELARYGLSVDPNHAERWEPPRYGQGDTTAAAE